jgi:PAS domain S-box-containing protein
VSRRPIRKRSEDPFRLVLAVAVDAIIVMKSNGTIAEWNDRAAEMFGWSRDDAVGRKLAEVIIPERYREAHVRGLKLFLETGEAKVLGKRIELSGLRKSGEEFPVELSISVADHDGDVVFVGGLRDITAQVDALEAVQARERQFELLVRSVKDYAIYMIDPQGRVISWNKGAQNIKGYSAEEIIGDNFSRFYTEEDQQSDLPARTLERAAAEGSFEGDGWRVRKDGSHFWANVVIDAVHDANGKLIGFAKVTRDITEKRQAQEMLEQTRERLYQSQKIDAIGQLTGGVAHDFNNLLTIILGNLDTAQRHVSSLTGGVAAQLTRVIGNAKGGAQRAAMLTQRLLAFSRRQPLNPKVMDVNKFIAGSVDFLQRSLGETIAIEAVGGGGLWQVEVDSNQFETSLLNLAINARDAMPEGGKLTIETSNAFLDEEYCRKNPEVIPGQYVLISVTDTGTGMTPEVASRAFEPFFTTKEIGQGTGLGLSQVYGFIKQSGGHIKIYSERGEGTAVKIYLPRVTAGDLVERSAEAAIAGEGFGETILVVEDDTDVRAYVVEALRELKYAVLEAPDATAALDLVERRGESIDLLLSDVVLPGLNGRELARLLKIRRPELKVLFMTGYSRNAIVHQGRLDPGVEVIQKPLTQVDLATRVRDLLDAAPRKKGG